MLPLFLFTFGAFSVCSRILVSRKPRFGDVGVGTRTGDTAGCRVCRVPVGGVATRLDRAALWFVLPAVVRARRLPMLSGVRAVGDGGSTVAGVGLSLPATRDVPGVGMDGVVMDLLDIKRVQDRGHHLIHKS